MIFVEKSSEFWDVLDELLESSILNFEF